MSALPVVVIAGRPNVGKSTLFNALTRTRDALVADQPGVTRDRIYGRAELDGQRVIVVDTGGLDDGSELLLTRALEQTRLALQEADLVVFVLDGRVGPSGPDLEIASELRRLDKPLVGVVNKTDGIDADTALAEYAELGLPTLVPVAAAHRRGLEALAGVIAGSLPRTEDPAADEDDGIRLALIGRPNVGKSTLLNRLCGTERAVTSDQPGTTRDPVSSRVERDGQVYRLVDTAGIRRRRGQHQAVESLSTLKAMQAMERAEVVALLLDATEGVTDQDARLAGHVVEAGRPLVIVLNKWDGLDEKQRHGCLVEAGERLKFVSFAPVVILSALHGSGLGELLDAIGAVYAAACRELPTPALTRALEAALQAHSPPASRRFAPKLRYAHFGGRFPTRIIIHGNRTAYVPDAYRRYLVNRLREVFDLTGVPVQLIFKDSDNPYAGRRNRLTPRQLARRKRIRKL